MVHVQVSESYIHFTLIYTADNILPVLPIKDLMNEDGDPAPPFNLATDTKPSMLHLRILFCPCIVQKATAHFGTKALNISYQVQKSF